MEWLMNDDMRKHWDQAMTEEEKFAVRRHE